LSVNISVAVVPSTLSELFLIPEVEITEVVLPLSVFASVPTPLNTVTVVETKSGGIGTGSNTGSGSKTSVVSISGDRQSSSTLDDTAVDQTLTEEISKSNEAGTIEKAIVTNTTDIR
jgi:hypothetical protein